MCSLHILNIFLTKNRRIFISIKFDFSCGDANHKNMLPQEVFDEIMKLFEKIKKNESGIDTYVRTEMNMKLVQFFTFYATKIYPK